MEKIVVKEVDKLKSLIHNGKVISEYLIYLDVDTNGHHANAFIEIGEAAKKLRVNELLLNHFNGDNSVIEEIMLSK